MSAGKRKSQQGLLKFVANKPYKFHVEVMMIVDKINLFSPWFFVVDPDDNTVHSDEDAMLRKEVGEAGWKVLAQVRALGRSAAMDRYRVLRGDRGFTTPRLVSSFTRPPCKGIHEDASVRSQLWCAVGRVWFSCELLCARVVIPTSYDVRRRGHVVRSEFEMALNVECEWCEWTTVGRRKLYYFTEVGGAACTEAPSRLASHLASHPACHRQRSRRRMPTPRTPANPPCEPATSTPSRAA